MGALTGAPLNRIFRVYATDKNTNLSKVKTGITEAVTLFDILDSIKSGFSEWLSDSYTQDFGGTAPDSAEALYQAFGLYNSLPALELQLRVEGTVTYVDAVTDIEGDFTYEWQYKDEEGNWLTLCEETGASINASGIELLRDGGKQVRCKMYDSAEHTLVTVSADKFIDPRRTEFDLAIQEINGALGLGELEIGGHVFNDLFYYGNVAQDSRVPFNNAGEYADYLAELYIDSGLEAVREAWDYYLYDLYDPHYKLLGNQKGNYPNETVGDGGLGWPKDSDSSFHGNQSPVVKQLSFDFLENGVDYSNFVSSLRKTATADAPGDANTERGYSIDLVADAQAKADGPVAIILQIQTSWQMFDMLHANAVKGDGATQVGSVSYNTELANLYAIKHALLRFVDYMETNHSSGNLVLGITEVQHAGSSSMLNGTDSSGKALYVSNDYQTLRQAILNWDSFGNCEHVHYDTDALKAASANLESNLSGWEDMYGYPIQYDDIQKVAVIIGGPTENSNSTNGYGCTLPWSTFRDAGINSVYALRTNNGTSNGSGLISWLDNSANNSGAAYPAGDSFTEKYVATTEDAIFSYLVQIAEQEMLEKGLDILATDKYVENVTVSDTIVDELFLLDTGEEIVATIYNKDGSIDTGIADNPRVLSLNDPALTIGPGEQPGTTKITYNFGTVYNTKKCALHFSVRANDDYVGSNNVYSNLGTPETSYQHTVLDSAGNPTGKIDDYTTGCYDTPEVNVPIRFNVADGGEVTILVGDTVDLADLSPAIVEHAESLIDNYDQINGVLSYTWVLPDGSEADAGSVTVTNGSIGAQNLPSREYEFTGEAPGQYVCTLKVTFTPDPVDTTSRNFSDANTAVPVGALTKSGNVWINVVSEDSTAHFIVRKIWSPEPPDGTDSLTFRVLANGVPVTGDNGRELTYTLDAANGWETEVSGLPSVIDGIIQEYSVEEYPVPEGYNASYSATSQTDNDYAAKAVITLTPKANQDNRTLRITCRYNGQEYTSVTPKGSYKNNQRYSFTVDNLPLDESGEPYDCELVSVIRGEDGKDVELSYSDTYTEKYLRSTSVVEVRVITNSASYSLPATGSPGALLFTFSGFGLTAGTLIYRYHARRRRERRTSR